MDGYHCITRLNFNIDLRSPFVLDFEDSPPKKELCPKLNVSPNCLLSRFYSIFLIILFRMENFLDIVIDFPIEKIE